MKHLKVSSVMLGWAGFLAAVSIEACAPGIVATASDGEPPTETPSLDSGSGVNDGARSPDRDSTLDADADADADAKLDSAIDAADAADAAPPPFVSGWDPRIGGKGIDAAAGSLLVDGAVVIVGGQFTKVRGLPANMVAAFDPSTAALTSIPSTLAGQNRSVNALVRYQGALVAGGAFTGGLAAQTADDFALLGGGVKLPGFVFGLAADATLLWVGGNFVTNDNSAANVTAWNGAGTTALSTDTGTGTSRVMRDGSDLWVTGQFIAPVNVPTMDLYGIGRYDLVTGRWTSIGTGASEGHLAGNRASVDAVVATPDFVYAAGDFAKMDGKQVGNIARWRRATSTWEALPGGGINGAVLDMKYDGTKLVVVGLLSQGGGVAAANVALFDTTTSTWSTLPDGGLAGQFKIYPPQVLAVAISGKDIYFAGDFATAGGLPSSGFAHYRGP